MKLEDVAHIKLRIHRKGIGKLFEKWGWIKPFYIILESTPNGIKVTTPDKKLYQNLTLEIRGKGCIHYVDSAPDKRTYESYY